MIKINLLKNASDKPVRRRVPVAKMAVTAIVCITALLVVGGGAALLRWWQRLPRPLKIMETAAVLIEKNAGAESTAVAPENDFEPSTHVKSKMIEDVVREVDIEEGKKKESGLVGLQYREMSRGEKINYEVQFAKNVVQALSRAVPDGIGFISLSFDSFSTISATGLGSAREQVGSLFSALRRERLDLLGPPHSYIKPRGRGFRFLFVCAPAFGMDQAEPYQATDRLEPRENLSAVRQTFIALAGRDGVFLRGGLTSKSTDKWGEYFRITYRISGRATYRNFVKFVLDLHDTHVACAFSKVRLSARNTTAIDIDADVIFTLRE